ncbi:MAG TPA: hypothetical protein VFK27_06770, partial [Bacillales bacterium]|nr:hypothetical protein [Bacillales bacterium]
VGIGITMMPLQTQGMNLIPDNKEGQGTAILNAAMQISNSFGVAWLSLLLSERSKFHMHANAAEVSRFSPQVQDFIAKIQQYADSVGLSMAEGKALAVKYLHGMVQLHSTVQAVDDIFYLLTFVGAGAAILTFALKTNKKEKAAAEPNKKSA